MGTNIIRELRAKPSEFAGLIFIRSFSHTSHTCCLFQAKADSTLPIPFYLHPQQRSANDSVEDVKMYRNAGATGVLSKNDKAIEVARDLLTKSHTALNMLMSESDMDL